MEEKITENVEKKVVETEKPKKVLKGMLPPPERVKKERTPAQIAAFEKAKEVRAANLSKKEADAKRLAEYDALIVKQKLKEKADKVKLKTMKKIETIESISSDEDEVIIEKPKVKPNPKPTPKPPPTPEVVKPPQKVVPYKFV